MPGTMTAPDLALQLAAEIAARVALGATPDPDLVDRYRAATTPPPPPRGRQPLRSFRCDDDLWERVTDEADRTDASTAHVLRRLIADNLPPRTDLG